MTMKALIRRLLRPRGLEVRAFRPYLFLDSYLWWLFRKRGINLVIDVGARCGEYGLWLRDNDYRGKIISFEPVEENFRVLQERAASDGNWKAYNVALGSSTGSAQINVMKTTDLSSFLTPSSYGSQVFTANVVQRSETVAIRRLDELFEELVADMRSPRVYLKIDTQGWDLEVLRGATGCLDRVVALQSEMSIQPIYDGSVDFKDALAEFERLDFAIAGIFAVSQDAEDRLVEFDCVMVKKSPQ